MRRYGLFLDREDAGRKLADEMARRKWPDSAVFGIARGGVAVAAQVAMRLSAPLRAAVPRKLPIPDNPEAGFGAVMGDGTLVLNDRLVEDVGLSADEIEQIARTVRAEVLRREREYDVGAPPLVLKGKTVILTDDGLATGYTMIAAVQWLRKESPDKIVVAVPVSPVGSLERVKQYADEAVCLVAQDTLSFAVASFYRDFHEMTDDEVKDYLLAVLSHERRRARRRQAE